VKFDYDGGGLGKGGMATLLVDEKPVGQTHIPQTVVVRFSLDETFDVGEDTGTPVVEDYLNKMPYVFTGDLKKLVVVLEPEKLSEDERARLRQEAANAYMAVQ
jgi:arylsulfatase